MQYVKVNWLNATSSTGPTDAEQVQGAKRYGILFVATGSPSSVNLILQGSLNGSDWFSVYSVNESRTGLLTWNDTSTSTVGEPLPDARTEGPVTYLRLNLVTLSGGTSPTVTASVIATD